MIFVSFSLFFYVFKRQKHTSIGVELLEWFDDVDVALAADIDMLDI